MTKEQTPIETAAPQPSPFLPESGLTYDQIRDAVARECKTVLSPDDPDLIVVAILNAFLEKQADLQKKHQEALSRFMSEESARYVATVKKGAEDVTKTLSALTTQGLNEAAKDLAAFRTTLFLCTAISAISALLIVTVFVLRGSV